MDLDGEGGPIALRIYRPTEPISRTQIHIHGGCCYTCTPKRPVRFATLGWAIVVTPALDLRPEAFKLPSRLEHRDPSLRAAIYAEKISAYVYPEQASDPILSPLAELDVSDLPPTLTVVLDADPLLDEGRPITSVEELK